MTFWPHPAHVLRPDLKLRLITTLSHRLRLLAELGVSTCVVIRFTRRFARISSEAFIERYLVKKIRPREVFVGDDFRFGADRAGTLDSFREAGRRFGFLVKTVPVVISRRQGQKIGSTLIRRLIAEGRLAEARRLLGRPVSVVGTVAGGERKGRIIGFPTVNIYPGKEVIPPLGVYAARIWVGDKAYGGMVNVGFCPSIKEFNKTAHIEAHLFDFHQKIYGREILIEFIRKIRQERVFASVDALVDQLRRDEQRARAILSQAG